MPRSWQQKLQPGGGGEATWIVERTKFFVHLQKDCSIHKIDKEKKSETDSWVSIAVSKVQADVENDHEHTGQKN